MAPPRHDEPGRPEEKHELGVDLGVKSKVYHGPVKKLTVSKLAEQVGTSPDALRYYERIGLLPPADRSSSGYRLYGAEAVERVSFVKRAQRLGLRLDDIRELLDIRERGLCPCGHTRQMLEKRVNQLDEELRVMARLRDDISQMLEGQPRAGKMNWQCGDELLQIRPGCSSSSTTKGGER